MVLCGHPAPPQGNIRASCLGAVIARSHSCRQSSRTGGGGNWLIIGDSAPNLQLRRRRNSNEYLLVIFYGKKQNKKPHMVPTHIHIHRVITMFYFTYRVISKERHMIVFGSSEFSTPCNTLFVFFLGMRSQRLESCGPETQGFCFSFLLSEAWDQGMKTEPGTRPPQGSRIPSPPCLPLLGVGHKNNSIH